MMASQNKNPVTQAVSRVRLWYGLLVLVIGIFGVRLFYVQVIHYEQYKTAALSGQLKQYEIPPVRGTISAHNGGDILPVVLNEQRYTLYADPVYIKKPEVAALKIAGVVGGDSAKYAEQMREKQTRYVVLAKKLSKEQQAKVTALKIPGIGTQVQNYRTYPQNSLAAQLLGFVNDEGQGSYGIEQALNKQLRGQAGQLRAITDAAGVPLAASKDNTQVAPKNGQKVVLTVDLAMQQQLESILAEGVKSARASGGSALIMDPYTGAVKAMANMPTYDPSRYFEVKDPEVFKNAAVTNAIEVGSTMKVLTAAAALDLGVVAPNTSYYDPASWLIDEFRVTNIEEDGGAGTRSVRDILNLSLNTGVTWLLMQMGGGEINQKGRTAWHDYLANRYQFGKPTGIEQGYESPGLVPAPEDNGAGINLTYANTAFGQAMTATPIQMGAALSSAVNGGTYYQPRLVDQVVAPDGKASSVTPKVVKQGVVSQQTSQQLIPLMQYVVDKHNFRPAFDQNAYTVGGKTGTAQIAKPTGGYYEDRFNGTYVGFVGGEKPQYVIIVFIDKPTNGGYAGTAAAQPVFGRLAHMLINDSYVTPKSN